MGFVVELIRIFTYFIGVSPAPEWQRCRKVVNSCKGFRIKDLQLDNFDGIIGHGCEIKWVLGIFFIVIAFTPYRLVSQGLEYPAAKLFAVSVKKSSCAATTHRGLERVRTRRDTWENSRNGMLRRRGLQ